MQRNRKTTIFKRRLVAFKGGFVGPSVRRYVGPSVLKNFFKKFWKSGFVNQIDKLELSWAKLSPNLSEVLN